MSIGDNQKLDFLWKKLGYGATKTDVNSIKNATNEAIPSPLLLDGNNLWTDAYQIPNLIPTASNHIVEIYDDSGNGSATVETIEDTTASSNRSWKTGLTNWIPPQFGSTYQVKVYIAPSGTATPQSTGTQVFASGSGNNDEWFFDYQSGVLNFIGDNLPTGINGNEIFVVGARYIGKLGNRFTALYADSADISHAFIDSADIITAYIDSADIMHAIIDSADITLGRITTAIIDSADIMHAFIDSADIGHARITYLDADSAHVYGRLTVGGDLIVDGNATIKSASGGNINLGDSNTDNIVFTADVNSNIRPNIDDAFDLGDSQQQWRNIYIDGAAYIDSANIDHAYIDSADVGLLNITGKITGPASFVIDPAAVGDNTGRVIILGDLQVDGTETIVNSTTVTINDKNIVLADSAPDAVWTDGAGITVAPGLVGAQIKYDQASDRWVLNRDLSHFDSGGALYFDSGVISKITSDSATITNLNSTFARIVGATIDSAGIVTATIVGLKADSAHVTGNLTVGGDLTVSGNATIKSATGGNIYLGDSNDDNIVFSGDINSHLIPNVNVTFDLGADSQRWRDLYLSGQSIYLGNLRLVESDGEFVVKKPDGSLTNIRASFIKADSAEIGQLRVDSATISRLSGTSGIFDSMNIGKLTTSSIDLGDGSITAGSGTFGNVKLTDSSIPVGAILTKLSNDSIGGSTTVTAENVRITTNNLLSGAILTLGDDDSISSSQNIKYDIHLSPHLGHTTGTAFLAAKEPILDSGYYRFSVDQTNDEIKGTNVGFKFGIYPNTPKGQYTQTYPFQADSNTLPFYGLEFNKDTRVLTSTAHTNIFKTSFTKDSAALQGDSSFALHIISSADSDIFSVERQGKVKVTNNINITGDIDFSGNLLQNGSPFKAGGVFKEITTAGQAYYITDTSEIAAPISSFLNNYNAYGHVGIQKNNPKYHMDIAGNFSVSGELDSFGVADLAYVINPVGANFGLYDDSDKSRLSFISNQAITRGGYFTNSNYRAGQMGLFSTAFGDNPRAQGLASVSIGQQTVAEGSNAVAIGNRSKVIAGASQQGLAIGYSNIIHGATGDGDYVAAVGHDQRVSGEYSVAYGTVNRLYGERAGVFGYNNVVGDPNETVAVNGPFSGSGSFVFGSGNRSLLQSNVLVGIDNEAMNGGTNVLVGKDNYSRSPSGSNIAIGLDNTIKATNSVVIGRRITIDSDAEASFGINLNPNVAISVLSERIMSIQGGNVIIGDDSDKFSNNDGNLYVKGDVIIRGNYLTEGAPGTTTSGTPFIDNGTDVEMTLDRNVVIGKSNSNFALSVYSRADVDSGRGVLIHGAIGAYTPSTHSDIFDSGGTNYSNEHSIMTYVPKLGTFIAGAMDPGDWEEYLSNGRVGYHGVVLGKENIAAGHMSVSIGAENKSYRGNDALSNALSTIGSETVLIGHQNITASDALYTGLKNYVFGRQNTLNDAGNNTYILGAENTLNDDGNNAYIVGAQNTISETSNNVYTVGKLNQIAGDATDTYLFGKSNQVLSINSTNQSVYIVGQSNRIDDAAQSVYVLGQDNIIISALSNINIIGHTNTVDDDAKDTYIFGDNNRAHGTSIRNYLFGDDLLVNEDAKNNFIVGRSIRLNSIDSNAAVFMLADPIGGVPDTSLNNTRMSVGRLPRVDLDDNNQIRNYALSLAGSLFLDSGSEIFVGSKSIKGFLGFSEPTVAEAQPAEIGQDEDPGALDPNSPDYDPSFANSPRAHLGLDSIVFDGVITNQFGSFSNAMRVRIPYDHGLYVDGTGTSGTNTFEARTDKAIRLTNVSTDSSLTTALGQDIATNIYFVKPIDEYQFIVLRDSHLGPPVLNNTNADSNIIEVAVNPTSILGFQFGESGGLKVLSYSPPIPEQIIEPDLDIGGDLTVLGKHLTLSADSLGVVWQKGDLRFGSLGTNPTSYTFDSAGLTTTGFITAGNITGDSAVFTGGMRVGTPDAGDAFHNYGITVLHDSNVSIGGMSFDSFVTRPDGAVIGQVIDFLDTDYVQSRVFVSTFFRHDENALYYYPESDNLPLVNTVLVGYKPNGNGVNRPTNLTNDMYGLNVAARSAFGAINVLTSNSIATDQNGLDPDGNPIGTIDLTSYSPITVDGASFPTSGYLRKTGMIDGDYIRSQAFDALGDALVKSIVDSAYILSAANDSSEWQRRENTLFFGTYPNVRHVNVGIRTDRPRRAFDVAGAVEFRDSALIGGALTANGASLTPTGTFNYLFDSSWLQVVDSDDLLQPDRRGFLGGGTFANVAQAITDAGASFSQGIIVQTSLDNPPGEGSPTESGKIKLRGFEIFKLDSLGNRIDLKWGGFKPGPLTNFQFDSYTEAYYTPEAGIGGNIVIDRDALDSGDINVIFRERDVYPDGSYIKIEGTASASIEALGQILNFDQDHTFVSIIDPEGTERELVKTVDFTFDDDSTITINDSASWMILGSTIKVNANIATLNSRLDVYGPTVLGRTPTYSVSNTPDISTLIKGALTVEDTTLIQSQLQLTGDSAKIIVGTAVDIDSQGIDIKQGHLVVDGILTGLDSYGIHVKAEGVKIDAGGLIINDGGLRVDDGEINFRSSQTTGTTLRIGGDAYEAVVISGGVHVDSLSDRFHIDSNVLFTFGPSINGLLAGFDSQVARVVDSNYIGERIADVWSFFTDSGGIQQIFYRRGDSNGMVVIGHPTNTVEGDSNTKFFVSNGNAIFNHAPANQPNWDVTTSTITDVVPDFGNSSRHSNTFKGSRMMWIPERGAFRAGAIDGTSVKWSDPEVGKSSVGIGYNTLSTDFSVAIGFSTLAGIMDPAHENQETTNAISIGYAVTGYAQDGVGIGHSITHSKDNTASVSVGYNIQNTGIGANNNVLIGHGLTHTTNGDDNVIVGHSSSVTGTSSESVVIGHSSSAIGTTKSISIGQNARSRNGGVAIGLDANAAANSDGIAIGNNVTVTNGGVAIGRTNTSATRSNTLAVGNEAKANQSGAVSVGVKAQGGGVSIGSTAQASLSGSVAIGSNVRASRGTTIGKSSSTNSYTNAVSVGVLNSISKSGVAVGFSNNLTGNGKTSIGSHNTSDGTAIGYGNTSGRNRVTIGQGNNASGYNGNATLIGLNNSASSSQGTVVVVGTSNTGNTNSYRSSVIVGINNNNNTVNTSSDLESIIIGVNNSNNNGSVIVGRYNTGNKNVHIFGDYNTSSSPDGSSGYIFGSSSTINRNGYLFGSSNTATDNGYAFGSNLNVSTGGYAFGSGNTASNLGIAFGQNNTSADGIGTIVFGRSNTGSTEGIAFGVSNTVSNEGLAFGAHNTASALDAVALGHGAVVTATSSVVIGVGSTVGGADKTVIDTNTFAVVGDAGLKVGIGLTSVDPLYRMEIGGHLNIPIGGDYYRHGKVLSDYITQDLITEAYVRNHADSDYIEGVVDLQYLRETITPAFFFASNTTTNDLEFTGTGSVGIGRANTNSSKYKLDIDGSINYTGKLYLDGDLIIPSKDSLNDVYITHQTLNLSIGPDSAESYFDSAYVAARQQMFGFTLGQTFDQVIDNSYINSRLDLSLFLDSQEANQLITDAINEKVAFQLDNPLLTGYNVTSFTDGGNTAGVKVGINKTADVFFDAAFIGHASGAAELQVDGNISIENGNLYVGGDNGTSRIFINGEPLENNTTFDASSVLGQTTYTLPNRIIVDVGGNIGSIPTPTFDMEVVGSFNIGSRSGKDAELLFEGENIFDILDSAYVQARQLVGLDSGDVFDIIDSSYILGFADSDYIRTVPDSAFIESFISTAFIRSHADSDYILSAADSAYVLSIADSDYILSAADSAYVLSIADSAYVESIADSNYIKGFIDQAYIRENADSSYVKGFITQEYVRNFADSAYVSSIAGIKDSAEVISIARNLVDSAYVKAIADSDYISSIAGIKDSAEVISIARNLVDSAYVNTITGIGAKDIDFGSNRIIYSNSYVGTSTRPNAGTYAGFFSVLSSTNKAYVTLQGDYKELALLEDIDSAYIQARQVDLQRDSNFVVNIIDSAYVQARIVPEGVDSAAVEAMVDSAYVLARSPQFDYINIIDSAYVNARVSTVDSAQVLAIVDSAHVKSIIDSDYILSITGSGGGSGSGTGGGSLVGYNFIATAGQTVFSGLDIEGAVLSYDATTATIVTANGITLTKGVDYAHTDSSNLTFTEARDSGDEISIFTTKAAADAGSTGSAGTTTTSVTVGTATIFDRTIHSNNFKSIEYTIHMEDSSLGHTQITKLLATYNKSQVFSTQYGTVSTFAGDSDLGAIDVVENGGQIQLTLTKASGTGTVKVVSNKTVVN